MATTGGYALIKNGPGPNGFIRSLGQYMLGSAATFGSVFFPNELAFFCFATF